MIPRVHEHIEMILDVENSRAAVVTLSIVATSISKNVALPHFFCDLLRRFATSLCIPCTYKHVKSLAASCRATSGQCLVRAGITLFFTSYSSSASAILVLQKIFLQRLADSRAILDIAQFFVIARERTSTSSILPMPGRSLLYRQ